jgi:hypothetical protein
VIARDAPRKLRMQYFGAVVAFVAAGLFALWLGTIDLRPALRGSADRVATVEFWPTAFAGIPLGVLALALAVMALAPKPGDRRDGRSAPLFRAMTVLVVACMPLTFLAVPVGRVLLSDVLTKRGYRECPATDVSRPPKRWTRADLACPT